MAGDTHMGTHLLRKNTGKSPLYKLKCTSFPLLSRNGSRPTDDPQVMIKYGRIQPNQIAVQLPKAQQTGLDLDLRTRFGIQVSDVFPATPADETILTFVLKPDQAEMGEQPLAHLERQKTAGIVRAVFQPHQEILVGSAIKPFQVQAGEEVCFRPHYPPNDVRYTEILTVERVSPRTGCITTTDERRFDKDGFEIRGSNSRSGMRNTICKLTPNLRARIEHVQNIQYIIRFLDIPRLSPTSPQR